MVKDAVKAEYLDLEWYTHTQIQCKMKKKRKLIKRLAQSNDGWDLNHDWPQNESETKANATASTNKNNALFFYFFFSMIIVLAEKDWISQLWRWNETIFVKKKLLIVKGPRKGNYNEVVGQKRSLADTKTKKKKKTIKKQTLKKRD